MDYMIYDIWAIYDIYIYIYIYIYIHIHTHTHIYIYIYIYIVDPSVITHYTGMLYLMCLLLGFARMQHLPRVSSGSSMLRAGNA